MSRKVKDIRICTEIEDELDFSADVGVEVDNDYVYIVNVITPLGLMTQMELQKRNFILPDPPPIIVKRLTEEIIVEAIEHYAKVDDMYWLNLCQFADVIDISVLDQLEIENRERVELTFNEGSDLIVSYIKKYIRLLTDMRVIISIIFIFTIISSIDYILLKPSIVNFLSKIIPQNLKILKDVKVFQPFHFIQNITLISNILIKKFFVKNQRKI